MARSCGTARVALHLSRWRGRRVVSLHELAQLTEDERNAKGLELLDSRFTPEWLAGHPNDRALADMMAARRNGAKTADQLRGRVITARSAQPARRLRPPDERITCPTLVACGRFDAIAPPTNAEAIAERVPSADCGCMRAGTRSLPKTRRRCPA